VGRLMISALFEHWSCKQ